MKIFNKILTHCTSLYIFWRKK